MKATDLLRSLSVILIDPWRLTEDVKDKVSEQEILTSFKLWELNYFLRTISNDCYRWDRYKNQVSARGLLLRTLCSWCEGNL